LAWGPTNGGVGGWVGGWKGGKERAKGWNKTHLAICGT